MISISAVLDNPRLPTPPALALQVIEKASRPDANLDEIVTLLGQDPGLCVRVLKTVNSSMFGLSAPVSSLKRAAAILGLRPLRSLVLSLSLPALQLRAADQVVVQYWQESVAGAVIARELSLLLRRPNAEDDLIAGLLRDLGVLVLRDIFPEEYPAVWAKVAGAGTDRLCAEERAAFGLDHAEVSAALLESWNLPPEIALPIRYHHEPEACTEAAPALQKRAWLLALASRLTQAGSMNAAAVRDLLHLARTQFALEPARLTKFLDAVAPKIRDFAALLKVDIGQCPNYAAIMAGGCDELVRLSVQPGPATAAATPPRSARPAPARLDQTVDFGRGQPGDSRANAGANTLPDFDLSCLDKVQAGGVRLNGYEVREILGQGGMGVVLKAYDPLLDRFVAVKMLKPEFLVRDTERERFLREARTAAAIEHQNVIRVYAVSEINSIPYLVMEYVAGQSLQDRLDAKGPLPLAEIFWFGRQIAAGLQAAHARRVIHRDIKPANILLSDSGQGTGGQGNAQPTALALTAKITDFGLARVLDEAARSQDTLWVGTPLFMAPEQFHSLTVDHRADLFSLGSLLYTLCAGTTPFEGATLAALMRQVCSDPPRPLRQRRPDVPSWLDGLISKLLAKLPAARPQSASEVLRCFESHTSGGDEKGRYTFAARHPSEQSG
jgi:HD-like signal output (HDOD) protein/tRNA A-37 threonylcarbamoyl transferase component Bud32